MKKIVFSLMLVALLSSFDVLAAPTSNVKPSAEDEGKMQQVFYVDFLQGFFKSAVITLKQKGISDDKITAYVTALASRVKDKELAEMTWPCLLEKGLLSSPTTFNENFKGEDAKACFTPWIKKFQADTKDLTPILTSK